MATYVRKIKTFQCNVLNKKLMRELEDEMNEFMACKTIIDVKPSIVTTNSEQIIVYTVIYEALKQ